MVFIPVRGQISFRQTLLTVIIFVWGEIMLRYPLTMVSMVSMMVFFVRGQVLLPCMIFFVRGEVMLRHTMVILSMITWKFWRFSMIVILMWWQVFLRESVVILMMILVWWQIFLFYMIFFVWWEILLRYPMVMVIFSMITWNFRRFFSMIAWKFWGSITRFYCLRC